jgi:hypothetical protein
MSRYHNPKLSQKVAKNVGKVVKTAVETKKILTHPQKKVTGHDYEAAISTGVRPDKILISYLILNTMP